MTTATRRQRTRPLARPAAAGLIAASVALALSGCTAFQPIDLFAKPERANATRSAASVPVSAQPVTTKEFNADNLPDVSGSATPGTIIGVIDNGALITKVTTDSTGVWRLTTADRDQLLVVGTHDIQVVTYDAAGKATSKVSPINRLVIKPIGASLAPDASGASGQPSGTGATTGSTTGEVDSGTAPTPATWVSSAATLNGGASAGSGSSGTSSAGTAANVIDRPGVSDSAAPAPTFATTPGATGNSTGSTASSTTPRVSPSATPAASPAASPAVSPTNAPGTAPAPVVTDANGNVVTSEATANPQPGNSVSTEASNPDVTKTGSLQIPQSGN